MKAILFTVHGRVQGVGFRYFVYRHAVNLGIRGLVRNRMDGSVEVLAVGQSGLLSEMEKTLIEGPAYSRVERVDKKEILPVPEFRNFRIEV